MSYEDQQLENDDDLLMRLKDPEGYNQPQKSPVRKTKIGGTKKSSRGSR